MTVTDRDRGEQAERNRTRPWGPTGRSGRPVLNVPSRIVVTSRFGLLLSIAGLAISSFILLGVHDVVSIGMYQLFVDPDLPVAGWMRMSSLDDWETQHLTVIVVLLAVTFLASAITCAGGQDVIYLGDSERRHRRGQSLHLRPPGQALIPSGCPQSPCGSEAGPAIPS